MQQLVLSFSEKTLTLLQKDDQGLSAAQFPLELNKPLVKERISAQIQGALSQSTLYRTTWFAADFTLFPAALFDPHQLQAYYELNHGLLKEGMTLKYDSIESLELVVIYSVPKWLNDYCKIELNQKQLQHEVSLQLQYNAQQKHSALIHVFFHENQFVLTVFKQKRLLTCTASDFQQESDFIYFLLAHQQKLGLDQSFILSLTEAAQGIALKSLPQILVKFKDFESFEIREFNLNTYQNNILCGSFEEH